MAKSKSSGTTTKEALGRVNLVTSEDTFSSQSTQNPLTARRVLSWIPNLKGDLSREPGQPKYLPTQLPSKVGALFQYAYNDTSGNRQTKQFAATATALYIESGGAWALQTLPTTLGLTTTAPFADYPNFVVINNLLHFSDGTTNWIYDGPNNQYVIDGFPIPVIKPSIDTSAAGSFSTTVGRYYWYTFADETAGRGHESSSSPISNSTGVIVNKKVLLAIGNDTVSTTAGSKNVASVSGFSPFVAGMVGQHLWVYSGGVGTDYGAIATFTDANHIILANNAPATNASIPFNIVPTRTTHLHWWGSESEGSRLGKYLFSHAINDGTATYDQTAFQSDPTSTMLNIDRPIRNDPSPASKILEMHKYRIFRRRETRPNFFNFTANEEVSSGNGNGSPQESVPGADTKTLSDLINEFSYPKPANRINALKSHADALYIGTENEIIPLYGDSIDNFGLSQITAIDGGVISRKGMESTSHGLVIFQFDRTLKLFPQITPFTSFVPENVDVTSQLIDIGRPMMNKFLTVKSSDQDNIQVLKYKFNSRDWLVVIYQDNNSIYHTYIYDFNTKSWFETQRGFVSVAVFEPTRGQKILVGGGTDGYVYVADDLLGQFTPMTVYPNSIFRTALIDFGNPAMLHEPFYIEYELTNVDLNDSITVNFYLDPPDVDSLPDPRSVTMSPVENRPNLFRGFFNIDGAGVVCKRLLVEINAASDTNGGAIRGLFMEAIPHTELMQ